MGIAQHLSPLALYLVLSILFSTIYASQDNVVAELRAKGIELVAPGDQGFKNASAAFNHRFTFQPAVVTFPTTPDQVSTIVQTAVKYKAHVSARSGGHSYIANGLGGRNGVVVIDMNRHFTNIQVDAASNRAIIQSGSRLGEIALTLNDQGQGLGHGTCPYVGIGGHASFGGFGYASRLWGMAMDSILSIDLVLANGTIATASKDQHPELFWGMRGAGPSFGITTSITFQTFPIPPSATVFAYSWDMNAEQASSVLDVYQTFSLSRIPLEFGSELMLQKGSRKGMVSVTLQGVWFGAAENFENVIRPLVNAIGQPPQNNLTQPGPYIDSVAFFGDEGGRLNTTVAPDEPQNFYVKSIFTPESQPMGRETEKAFMAYLANEGFTTDLNWFIEIEEWGGPGSIVNAVPLNETAFATRDALFLVQFYGFTNDAATPFPNSGFTLIDGMVHSILNHTPSDWKYSAYPNYLDNRLEDWQRLYFGTHYRRLQQLKASLDPSNTFQFPTSIELP